MNKTSERLKDYQTQMSIYAEQHKLILASDVLDMIEQLHDDLKDDIDKVVEELEKLKDKDVCSYAECATEDCADCVQYSIPTKAIDIVKRGGRE